MEVENDYKPKGSVTNGLSKRITVPSELIGVMCAVMSINIEFSNELPDETVEKFEDLMSRMCIDFMDLVSQKSR